MRFQVLLGDVDKMNGGIVIMADMYQFSEEFQLKILALMSRDRRAFVTYSEVIRPSYFRKAIHIDICRIIHEHYDKEATRAKLKGTDICAPTMEVMWEEVRKLVENNKSKSKIQTQYEDTVIDMYQVPLDDAEYIKDSLVQFGKRSAIERAIIESVEDIEKGTNDFSKIEERITKAIRVGEDIEDLGMDFFETAEQRMKLYEQNTDGVRRVPTGLVGIDRITKGGIGDGELAVCIAPPNRGKSMTLINIGAGALVTGHNVIHYTLEMPEEQVAKRYDQRLVKKDFEYLRGNGNKVLTALMNMKKIQKGELHIKRFPSRSCNINKIKAHLTQLEIQKGFKPDLIIIDYGDLIQPLRTYADKRFELESVYLDMRDLAVEFSCPVWTASQTNRDGLNKKVITISDLAEAFNKSNIADFMMAFCQTQEEKEDGELRMHIAKQRDGIANVTLEGDIDYSTSTINVYEADF